MIRRGLIFIRSERYAKYDTTVNGPWTLCELVFADPEKQTNYLTIPGRDGAVDLLAGISDGEPRYKQRTLTARLECSERDRRYRTELIDGLRNLLDGYTCQVILPDDPMRHVTGVVSVAVGYNDPNHCEVTITAECDPWRELNAPVMIDVACSSTAQTVRIQNKGRRRAVPTISAYAAAPAMPNVTVSCGAYTETITDYTPIKAAELAMRSGDVFDLSVSGSGHFVVTWEEAIL